MKLTDEELERKLYINNSTFYETFIDKLNQLETIFSKGYNAGLLATMILFMK